jgi:hypothetical protein
MLDVDVRPGLADVLSRAPRWPFHLAFASAGLVFLWGESAPGEGLGTPAALALMGLTFGWLVRVGLVLVCGRHWSWWLVVLPVSVAVLLTADAQDRPLRVRFHFSESAFDRAAASYAASSSAVARTDSGARRIGSFDVRSITDENGAVLFSTGDADALGETGFAYLPPGVEGD